MMAENNERGNELLGKLDMLLKRQDLFLREIHELREEINQLKTNQENGQYKEIIPWKPLKSDEPVVEKEPVRHIHSTYPEQKEQEQRTHSAPVTPSPPNIVSDMEKFIGENLINKIGIAITVIGVAIGAKYSIEHDLISPITRIILGYLMGIGLLGVGIRLKKKYISYSAVLVSGAIAILYFMTYAAYSFYELIPQSIAFALMVIFTAFSVAVAINYNKQVIAHIGLVGAYAVPFLLSDDSGKAAVLFGYMAIINIGILLIAFRKYWKPLYYSSFIMTWLIFLIWFMSDYKVTEHFQLSLFFLSIFFAIFYLIFLGYKLLKKEKFDADDILLLLSNSFLFYGTGYAILSGHETGQQLLGIFTFFNAIVHFIACMVVYRQKLADRNLFYLLAGLVLTYITMTIPVQLEGSWVTMLWAFEATLLFWIGRTKNEPFYEKLSYVLMFLAFFSILHDWISIPEYLRSKPETKVLPLLNIHFLTAMLFIASFGFINYLKGDKRYSPAGFGKKEFQDLIAFSIPAMLLLVLYYTFRLEISRYLDQLFIDSRIMLPTEDPEFLKTHLNMNLRQFKPLWIINYSMLFFTVLSFVNIKKLRHQQLGVFNLFINFIVLLVFLIQGLFILSELRESYLSLAAGEYYHAGSLNIGIRYISFAFVGFLLFSIDRYIRQDFMKSIYSNMQEPFDLLLDSSILWIASSELLTWMDVMRVSSSDKLGLSILWGLYALLLIVLGIWKTKKHLRIGALVLFTVTLLKLFFYDLSHFDTIAKTIVFVSLGLLLLIISFLYQKYKHLISAHEN